MTIGTDSAIEFFGTTDALDDTTTSAVSDGAMSASGDIAAWTNDDDAPFAKLILRWQYATGTIDGHINIHIRPLNVDGTDDVPQPTTANPINLCGRFEISPGQSAATDTVYVAFVGLVPWSIKTSQEYEFYLFNDSGVDMSANWDLDIVPATLGPHA